jgi:hypothetical protein
MFGGLLNGFKNQGLLSNFAEIPLQLGKDYLYQKIGGDWLGIDKYEGMEDQEMSPFQKQLLVYHKACVFTINN